MKLEIERPWISGWELTTNEKGVEMATLPAQMLRNTLAYVEKLEQQCKSANDLGHSEQCYHEFKVRVSAHRPGASGTSKCVKCGKIKS